MITIYYEDGTVQCINPSVTFDQNYLSDLVYSVAGHHSVKYYVSNYQSKRGKN